MPKPVQEAGFYITVNFTHGDADAYSEETWQVATEDDVFAFIDQLRRVDAVLKDKFKSECDLSTVADCGYFVCVQAGEVQLADDWPEDVTCDEYAADVSGIEKVEYSDGKGNVTPLRVIGTTWGHGFQV